MPHTERILAEQSYAEDKKYKIKSTGQRSPEHESEDEIKHDLKENSIGKASLIEATLFSAEKQLNSENNFEIIDKLTDRDGASQELGKKFQIFIDKMGSKNIIHNNSAKDLIEGSATVLFLSCARIKKITSELIENEKLSQKINNLLLRLEKRGDAFSQKLLESREKQQRLMEEKIIKKQKLETNQDAVINEFKILNDYFNLLTNKDFEAVEKEELGTELGFLKNHLIRKKIKDIGYKITDKKEYAAIERGVENEIKMLRSRDKNKYIALIKKFSQNEKINN